MINIKEINREYILSAIFGVSALILSFLIGFLAGNGIGPIIFRSVISMIVFSIIGFAGLYVIKRFVPEVYEIIDSGSTVQIDDSDLSIEESEEVVDAEQQEAPPIEEEAKVTDLDEEFSSEKKANVDDSDLDLSSEEESPAPGTDLQEKIKYEPEIAAQAIRTMMKKDEE